MIEEHTAQPLVEVYWRPGCPFCMMLLPPLRRSGLQLREGNIWEDPQAAARCASLRTETKRCQRFSSVTRRW